MLTGRSNTIIAVLFFSTETQTEIVRQTFEIQVNLIEDANGIPHFYTVAVSPLRQLLPGRSIASNNRHRPYGQHTKFHSMGIGSRRQRH